MKKSSISSFQLGGVVSKPKGLKKSYLVAALQELKLAVMRLYMISTRRRWYQELNDSSRITTQRLIA
jgi:hypothetical protein